MRFKDVLQFSLKFLNFNRLFVTRSTLFCISSDRNYNYLIPFAYCVKGNHKCVPTNYYFQDLFHYFNTSNCLFWDKCYRIWLKTSNLNFIAINGFLNNKYSEQNLHISHNVWIPIEGLTANVHMFTVNANDHCVRTSWINSAALY